ncbi:uncharacterized protein LOC123446945 [Hordeum vulgare subsp. vulgare]|uniref:DUF3615 domain-containing protein n=1 Tax=Hordeum vulgare subsp. vulgare TaxID=112509 RepID=A0A8I6XEI5_HORVV|nr:uncharacterized protein LOC123446945 [Hordeum vulgare subsp. vulgare]XP_044979426.1 uncharacterized protein LOC123446945 [Hordeum vulgare subsp. vulgare]
MPPPRRRHWPFTILLPDDDDGRLVTGGSEGRPVGEIFADTRRRLEADQDAARRRRHPQRRPQPRPPSDAASTTQPPPTCNPSPSPPLYSTPPSDAAHPSATPSPPVHGQLQPPQPEPIPYTPGTPRPTLTDVDVDATCLRIADAFEEFAYSDGDGQLFTDVDEISQRVADVRMEVTCSNIQTRPYDRPQPPQCEYPYYDVPEPLEKPLLEPKNANASSSSTQPVAITHDISPVSRQLSPPIFARNPSGWHLQFFIRIDVGGYFHTYPSLGGPFQSLQEAENAIASHLDELRSPMMCTDGLSDAEICIRHGLYWLDGTRKSSSEGNPDHRNVSVLVQALLDKYNEDHHLLGDLAYELDDVVIFREFYEGENLTMFYHINLTTKTKGKDGSHSGINNLFFAEVREIEGEIEGENDEYVLNCLCMVKPTNNGQCYGCMTYGNVDLKHPVDVDKYEGGHSTPHKLCCGFDLRCDVITGLDAPAYIEDEEARLMAEEARLRYINMCPADPPVLAKLDGARVPVGLAKRKDSDLTKGECGQGSVKYIVPARRMLV